MSTRRYILTRHAGATAWIRARVRVDEELSHLEDLSRFRPDDELYGVFPLHMAASLCAMGVRCFHIEFDLPESMRGRELTEAHMEMMNTRLNEYLVFKTGTRPTDEQIEITKWKYFGLVPDS